VNDPPFPVEASVSKATVFAAAFAAALLVSPLPAQTEPRDE
jgi:hypothetical protein